MITLLKNKSLNELLQNPILQNLNTKEWVNLIKELYGNVSNKNLIKIITHKIINYDRSLNVNGFLYKDEEYWFDKVTRNSLLNLLSYSDKDFELVLRDNIIKISSEKLKTFLYELEAYANKCYIITQKHLNSIKNIDSFGELVNYDYTRGYPKKIILNE